MGGRKKSSVWKFYKENENPKMVKCVLCDSLLSRGGSGRFASTSALTSHLRVKHVREFATLQHPVHSPNPTVPPIKASTSKATDEDSEMEYSVARRNLKRRRSENQQQANKQRVSLEQQWTMFEVMVRHRCLAIGRVAGLEASRKRKDMLEELTRDLNAMDGGATKSPDKWWKSWQDWRSDVKAKAAKIKKCQSSGQLEPPPLTELEDKLLQFCAAEEGPAEASDPIKVENVDEDEEEENFKEKEENAEVDDENFKEEEENVEVDEENFKEEEDNAEVEEATAEEEEVVEDNGTEQVFEFDSSENLVKKRKRDPLEDHLAIATERMADSLLTISKAISEGCSAIAAALTDVANALQIN